MAWNTPGVEVAGAACARSRFGLLSVAEIEDVEDGHWEQGFHHEELSCEDIETRAINCPPPTEPKDVEDAGLHYPVGDAFTLIAPFKCSTAGIRLGDAWDHAEERLLRAQDRSLERVFWTGRDALGNRVRGTLGAALAVPDDDDDETDEVSDITPATGAVSITDGLALLEQWAGEHMACQPIIHSARGIATYLAERNLIVPDGTVMHTRGADSRVAIGGGYRTSGPDNVAAAPGEAWLWITGSVKIRRAPTFFTPERTNEAAALDQLVNDVTVFAERTYGALRQCGAAAIRVNLRSCCC